MFNETKEAQFVNEVTIHGVIVHKYVTDKVAILTVSTGNATLVVNYPKIIFFGDIRNDVEKNYQVRDHVCIKGNIQSSKKKENIKNQIMQSVFAESIEKTRSRMETAFNIKDGSNSFCQYENMFKLAGEVVSVDHPTDNITRMVLKTHKNNRISFPRLVCFAPIAKDITNTINVGDFVYAIGCVQTTKKEAENGVNHYENYVITELKKK